VADAGRPLLVLVCGKDPFDEPGGGHSSYVRAHARAAVAAGWSPVLVCVGRTTGTRACDFGTIRRFRSRWRPLRQLMIPGHAGVLARGVEEVAAATTGPVLVHGFGVWGAGAVRGAARLRATGRDAVAAISSYTTYRVEHDSLVRGAADEPLRHRLRYRAQAWWARLVVDRWERDAYRAAERVWVNYDAVARLVRAAHGDAVAVERIGYGPESAFEPLPDLAAHPVPAEVADLTPAAAPLVVCVARHHSRKGLDVLIAALDRLRRRGVEVRACLVGFGPLLDAHRHLVAELGLTDRVAVPGGVPEVEPFLLAADVVVLPSREEQSGALAVLEAQRLGRAVVASGVDGIPEDVTDGETGLLVPPGDPDALADALAALIADPERRRAMAAAGRRRFEERFAAGPFVAALSSAYADLGFRP
jgi:glycosyltransferase involved in cell wall biosynthesis